MAETSIEPFAEALRRHRLRLCRDRTTALQVNVGRRCDLACRHCHLEAGPDQGDVMTRAAMEAVIACARRFSFASIDITGGSPELVPGIGYLLASLAPLTPRLLVRTNLVALCQGEGPELCRLFRELGVVLVASLPATNLSQTEAQRGDGVWEKSIAALRMLNGMGYGREGSPLELDLVSNPAGAFLPPAQKETERRFRSELNRRHGVEFHALYTFANVPLGRFRTFLERSGNLDSYLARLADGFNPCTVPGLMCRSQLSVDWQGRLFDCDFNLAAGIPPEGAWPLVGELTQLPPPGTPISVGNHCYACTVGSGFT